MKVGFIVAVALVTFASLALADQGGPEWSTWTLLGKSCKQKVCGKATETYKRKCIGGTAGTDCAGQKRKTEECQDLPPCASWGEWKAKGKCKSPTGAKCGAGQQKFKRKCIKLKNGKKCPGKNKKFEPCDVGTCATWGAWQDGECSVSCGDGTMTQTRQCQPGIGKCDSAKPQDVEEREAACNKGECVWLAPINCDALSSSTGYYKSNIRYDMSPKPGYSWTEARTYCKGRGGDLPVTDINDSQLRTDLVNAFNLQGGLIEYLYIGMERIDGKWTFVDGTIPDEDSIDWIYAPNTGYDAAQIYVDTADLKTMGVPHDSSNPNHSFALCEYRCAIRLDE